jgi:hypothetical protein
MDEYPQNRYEDAAMYTLALSTLAFHALATVTMVLGVAVNACLPWRRAQA